MLVAIYFSYIPNSDMINWMHVAEQDMVSVLPVLYHVILHIITVHNMKIKFDFSCYGQL
jgi:hypothetical protein